MEARIISQSKLPDTYGEWLKDYEKNVMDPMYRKYCFVCAEHDLARINAEREFHKQQREMKKHYNIDQPKINHVEITCHIEL